MIIQRLQRLRERMAAAGVPALLVTKVENRRYMSGFTGTWGWLLVTPQEAYLITDSRYTEQARAQAPDYKLVQQSNAGMLHEVRELAGSLGLKALGVEPHVLTHSEYRSLAEKLHPIELMDTDHLVEDLRKTKDPGEVDQIRQALAMTDRAFEHILTVLKPGMREKDVALELEYTMRQQGAEALSFDTIVASGPRSALPHGIASDRVIEAGDFVTMDFGCKHGGYCSDFTRTVSVGQAPDELRRIYDVVRRAQQAALEAVRPGMVAQELDAVARRVIDEAGYGKCFGHGLGHGVGLEIHEAPRLGVTGQEVLKPGMIITIEPGVYVPGLGGVRIEDMVCVTEQGGDDLTRATHDFIVL